MDFAILDRADLNQNRRTRWGHRLYRPIAFGLTVVLAFGTAIELGDFVGSEWAEIYGAGDLSGYLVGARRFLDTGSPYLPEQVARPWTLARYSFIHPPAALALFLPFLALPALLWWVIPIGLTVLCVARLRPAPWTWPVIVLCLAWPRSLGSLFVGSSDMWAMAFVASGAVAGWPAVLLIVKPTFAPLAIIGARSRSWWIAAGLVSLAVVASWPLWLEYAAVIRNAGLSPDYGLLNLPLVALPAVAWLGRRRQPVVGTPGVHIEAT